MNDYGSIQGSLTRITALSRRSKKDFPVIFPPRRLVHISHSASGCCRHPPVFTELGAISSSATAAVHGVASTPRVPHFVLVSDTVLQWVYECASFCTILLGALSTVYASCSNGDARHAGSEARPRQNQRRRSAHPRRRLVSVFDGGGAQLSC